MSSRGLVDTGPLVAVLDKADRFHAWTVEAVAQFDAPLHSSEAVLSEAWHLLGRARGGRHALLGVLGAGLVVVPSGLAVEGAGTYRLMTKYADQPMSVADASLVRMAELDPRATIITLDRDFLVYRRGRSPLRLSAPFVGEMVHRRR